MIISHLKYYLTLEASFVYINKSVPFKLGDIIKWEDIIIQVEEIIPYVDKYHTAVSFVGKRLHRSKGELIPYVAMKRDSIYMKMNKPNGIKKLN